MEELEPNKKYISWPVLALMDFVTVIGFDDLAYNFQSQGMGVITSWAIMLFLYVIPYSLMVGQLGSVFNKEGGGLTSWIRGTNGEFLGYFTAWTYWAASIPYVVDTANSLVVGLGWLFNGNAGLQNKMSNGWFAFWTLVIFVVFIFTQSRFKRSLEILSTIGGVAIFGLTILFVLMTFTGLAMGGHIATQPFTIHTIIPKFNLHYLTTLGLLIYAMNGAELIAPFVTKLRHPKSDFPKAMIMLAALTAFLTIFGSFSLGVFFNAYHLPKDLKMNGAYYAFQALGAQYHLGNILLYVYALAEVFYLAALLAVLLDAMTRMLISDTGNRYMPKVLKKTNSVGLPVNGYLLTCGLSAFIMSLGIFLPSMNDIFNWLLNLNGIISPGVTCWVFFAFIKIRQDSQKYQSDYVFIKNDKTALTVGWWCLIVTAIATIFGIGPQDVKFASSTWWYELIINFVSIIVLIGLGLILPYVTRREERSITGSAFTRWQWSGILTVILLTIIGDLYLGGSKLAHNIAGIVGISIVGILLVIIFGWKEYNLKEN
ncbi:amino acid permease [Companilactobacillus crustorum]|uniref:APC family permease n=1 Tax=Companilactobacillus crustorum TaxID=392416 RepID=UPI00237DBBE5|nr:amino acid permease [Companilactobacillus crustorum]WDT65202.1 amino acid permease [Companilactobacillus crustorum]